MLRRRRASALLLLLSFALGCFSPRTDWTAATREAREQGEPIPVLSTTEPEADAKRAYALQRELVEERLEGDRISGFKAALTSAGARLAFGAQDTAWGVLFEKGRRPGGATIEAGTLRSPMVEVEIGFVFRERIDRPLAGVDELRGKVLGLAPVVEVPETGFAPGEPLVAADLIAANAGSALFLVGKERALGNVDPSAITVELKRDGKLVSEGRGSDVIGGQWAGLLWLANSVVEGGYTIEPGQVLITGALGRPVAGEPGRYEATFGPLDPLAFTLQGRSGAATP